MRAPRRDQDAQGDAQRDAQRAPRPATDELVEAFDERCAQPWTVAEYERVRRSALALVRSHRSSDLADGRVLTIVDGARYWDLLGALDRAPERTDE